MVRAGEFRQDLFYRINTIQLMLPPLRERENDIIVLARHRFDRLCRQRNLPPKEMDPEFVEMLKRHDWPGNVRELFNTIEQTFVLSGSDTTVYAQHLPQAVRIRVAKSMLVRERGGDDGGGAQLEPEESLPSLKEYKSAMEREYLLRLLKIHDKDIQKMINVSGLSRSHLYAMLKKHDLAG